MKQYRNVYQMLNKLTYPNFIIMLKDYGVKIDDIAHELEKRRMKICNKKAEKE